MDSTTWPQRQQADKRVRNRVDKKRVREEIERSIKIFSFIIYLVTTLGFTFQAYLICSQFFKYPTTTLLSVEGALKVTNFPQVALCAGWSINPNEFSKNDEAFYQHQHPPKYTYPWGSPVVKSATISRNALSTRSTDNSTHHTSSPDQLIQLGYFIQQKNTCIWFKTKHPLNLDHNELFRSPSTKTIDVTLGVKTPWSGIPYFLTNRGRSWGVYVYMTAYDSDFDAPALVPIRTKTDRFREGFMLTFTFSQKVTQLMKPPYDTNCRDYRLVGIPNQNSCIRRCVNEWTIKEYQMIFENHAVDRYRYLMPKDPSTHLKPLWFALKDEGMTADSLFNLSATSYKLEKSCLSKGKKREARNAKMIGDYMRKFGKIIPAIKKRIIICEQVCRQPDCHMEYIVPVEVNRETFGSKKNISIIQVGIYPPKEQVVVVISNPKLNLIDFIVYVLSCLSFWFGFCPLTTAKKHEVLFDKEKLESADQIDVASRGKRREDKRTSGNNLK